MRVLESFKKTWKKISIIIACGLLVVAGFLLPIGNNTKVEAEVGADISNAVEAKSSSMPEDFVGLSNVVAISTVSQLRAFISGSAGLDSDASYAAATYGYLVNDIDGYKPLDPTSPSTELIGGNYVFDTNKFFDGNGFTIRLTPTQTASDVNKMYKQTFAEIGTESTDNEAYYYTLCGGNFVALNKGTIRNVNFDLANSYSFNLEQTDGNNGWGVHAYTSFGIVSGRNEGTIQNCSLTISSSVNASFEKGTWENNSENRWYSRVVNFGGYAGTNAGIIKDCSLDLDGTYTVISRGVQNSGTYRGSIAVVGGMVGVMHGGKLQNSSVTGSGTFTTYNKQSNREDEIEQVGKYQGVLVGANIAQSSGNIYENNATFDYTKISVYQNGATGEIDGVYLEDCDFTFTLPNKQATTSWNNRGVVLGYGPETSVWNVYYSGNISENILKVAYAFTDATAVITEEIIDIPGYTKNVTFFSTRIKQDLAKLDSKFVVGANGAASYDGTAINDEAGQIFVTYTKNAGTSNILWEMKVGQAQGIALNYANQGIGIFTDPDKTSLNQVKYVNSDRTVYKVAIPKINGLTTSREGKNASITYTFGTTSNNYSFNANVEKTYDGLTSAPTDIIIGGKTITPTTTGANFVIGTTDGGSDKSDVGSYNYKATSKNKSNYLYVDATNKILYIPDDTKVHNVSITPKPLSLTFSDYSNLVYNATQRPLIPTLTGIVLGDNVTISISYEGRNGTNMITGEVPVNVGDYTATIEIGGTDIGNYDLSSIATTIDYSIAVKQINVVYNEISESLEYDFTNKLLGYTIVLDEDDNLYNDGTSLTWKSELIEEGNVVNDTNQSAIDAGNYRISAILTGENAGNYEITTDVKEFVIAKKALTTQYILSDNLIYNGTSKITSILLNGLDAILGYTFEDGVVFSWRCTGTTAVGAYEGKAPINVGSYTISSTISGEKVDNYDVSGLTNIQFEIAQQQVEFEFMLSDNLIYDNTNKITVKIKNDITLVGGVDLVWDTQRTYNQASTTQSNGQAINVGSYVITPSLNGDFLNNYAYPSTTKEFEIIPVSIAFDYEIAENNVYDGNNKFSATLDENSSLISGDGSRVVWNVERTFKDQVTLDTNLNVIDAGSYVITPSIIDANDQISENYVITNTAAEFEIRRALVNLETLSFNSVSQIYDGAKVSLEYVGELPEGVEFSGYTGGEDGANGRTNAGSSEITATFEISDDNYTFEDEQETASLTATIKVEKAPVQIVWEYTSAYEYNGEEQTVTASVEGAVAGETVEVESYLGNKQRNAGEYTATAIVSQTNYYISAGETLNWKIARKEISLDGIAFNNKEQTYTGNKVTLEYVGELPEGVTFSGYAGGEDGENGRTNAGSSEITATFTVDDNHVFGEGKETEILSATLTIAKAVINIADYVEFNAKTSAYTGKIQTIEYVGELPEGVSFSGYAGGEDGANGRTNVGSSEITATFEIADQNYTFVQEELEVDQLRVSAIVEITAVKLTLTFSGYTDLVYNGQERVVVATLNGLVNDETLLVDISYTKSGGETLGSAPSNAGEYIATAQITGEGLSNYDITEIITTQAYTIAAKEVTVAWEYAGAYEYNGEEQTVTASVEGIVAGETIDLVYEGNKETKVGKYTANVITNNANYTIVGENTLTWEISRKLVTLSELTFADIEQTYTGNKVSLEYVGELPEGVSFSGYAGGEDGENGRTNAGSSEITATFTVDDNHVFGEGRETEILSATLTIMKAVINVSEHVEFNGKTNVYNGYIQTLEYVGELPEGVSFSGYAGGEDGANGRTNVGSSEITATFEISDDNYIFEDEQTTAGLTATLKVEKAPIQIIWDYIHEYEYNGEEQTVIASVEGAVAGETIVLIYEGNKEANAGEYTATAKTNNANYTIVGETTLSWKIARKAVTLDGISFNDVEQTYTGILVNITFTGELPEGVTFTGYTGGEDGANGRTNVGSSEITATFEISDDNYTFVEEETEIEELSLSAILEITPAKLTLTFSGYTNLVYNGQEREVTAALNGLVNNETLLVDIIYAKSGGETLGSAPANAGEYIATAQITGEGLSNYDITDIVTTQAYTIAAKEITITWEYSGAYEYNGEEQTVTASVEGIVAGETIDLVYQGNKAINAGEYTANVNINNTNYTIVGEKTLTWKISRKLVTLSGVTFDDLEQTYNGTKVIIEYVGDLPTGVSFSGYTGGEDGANGRTNAGSSEITATFEISDDNYTFEDEQETASLTATIKVEKAPVQIVWEYTSAYEYNGEEQTVTASVEGAVAGETVEVESYLGNKQRNAGEYTATAIVSQTNYYISAGETLSWKIARKEVLVNWNVSDGHVVVADGSEKMVTASLIGVIAGDNVDITYEDASSNVLGRHIAKVVSIDNENYLLESASSITWYLKSNIVIDLTNMADEYFYDNGKDMSQYLTGASAKLSVKNQDIHNSLIRYNVQNFASVDTYDIIVSVDETDEYLGASVVKKVQIVAASPVVDGQLDKVYFGESLESIKQRMLFSAINNGQSIANEGSFSIEWNTGAPSVDDQTAKLKITYTPINIVNYNVISTVKDIPVSVIYLNIKYNHKEYGAIVGDEIYGQEVIAMPYNETIGQNSDILSKFNISETGHMCIWKNAETDQAFDFNTELIIEDVTVEAEWTLSDIEATISGNKTGVFNEGLTVITLSADINDPNSSCEYAYNWVRKGTDTSLSTSRTLELSKVADSGEYEVSIVVSSLNTSAQQRVKIIELDEEVVISPKTIDLSNVIFNNKTITFNGKNNVIEVDEDSIPLGAVLTGYEGGEDGLNGRISAGSSDITANFVALNANYLVNNPPKAVLKIEPKVVEVVWENLQNPLKDNIFIVKAYYLDVNDQKVYLTVSGVNVENLTEGSYELMVEIDDSNYSLDPQTITAQVTIEDDDNMILIIAISAGVGLFLILSIIIVVIVVKKKKKTKKVTEQLNTKNIDALLNNAIQDGEQINKSKKAKKEPQAQKSKTKNKK